MRQSAPRFYHPNVTAREAELPVHLHVTPAVDTSQLSSSHSVLQQRCKRAIDLLGGALLLGFFAPLLTILYIVVKLDGGPALFGHERVGNCGVMFKCWKFRTMVVNADRVLAELLARDPEAAAEWRRDFKLKNDPRITPLGRLLRLTSLDELPQLWNVIRGEMSLVGPRPIVRDEMNRYGAQIFAYLSCRPGLTGLWQVSGRNDVSYAERVALDAAYAAHWTIRGDLAIALKTVGVMVNRSGAY